MTQNFKNSFDLDSQIFVFILLKLQAKKDDRGFLERDRNQIQKGSILKIFYTSKSHNHKSNSMTVSFLYKINLKT